MSDLISEKRWQRMWHFDTPIRPWNMPREPGCYVIYLDRKLIYIGQTTDLFDRICSHQIHYERNECVTPWGRGSNVHCRYKLSIRYGDWLMREARLIRRLQPPGNKRGNRAWRVKAA